MSMFDVCNDVSNVLHKYIDNYTIPPPPGSTAILLSSNSAVLINIITGVSPPHCDFVVYYVLCQC
jgi:hypothetical protein